MARSSANRVFGNSITERAIAAGTIPPFAPVGPPNSSGLVSALTSGLPYGYSANEEELEAGQEVVYIIFGDATVIAGGSIAIGATCVPTSGSRMIATTSGGQLSNCRVRNDGSALSGYTDGQYVPVTISNGALVN
jgi:hypothetical protein